MVWGYASTQTRDDQGEIINRDAIADALPEYMKLGNIREMHQLSAVGKAKEAQMDENGLFLGAKVVDPLAWEKVKEGVYSGFSIGGRVTKRDSDDPKTITGLVLSEISLVDRPANPDALFDVWKSADSDIQSKGTDMEGLATIGDLAGDKLAAMMTAPVQIWACGMADHQHAAKADALKCMEKRAAAEGDPGAAAEAVPADDTLTEKAEATNGNLQKPTETGGGGAEIAGDADDADDKNPDDSGSTEKAAAVDGEVAPEAEAAPEPLTPAEIEKRAQEGAAAAQAVMDAAVAAIERGDAVLAGNEPVEKAAEPVDAETSEGNVRATETNQTISGDDAEKTAQPVENTQEQAADQVPGNIPVGETGPDVSQVSQPVPTVSQLVPTLPDAPAEKASSSGGLLKSMYDLGDVASAILFWDGLAERLKMEALLEDDRSPAAAQAASLRDQACGFLRSLVAEETGELMAGTEIDEDEADFMWMAEAVGNLRKAGLAEPADWLEKAGAKHGARDQMLLDKSLECASQAMALDGCTKAAHSSLGDAATCLEAAGAKRLGDSTEKAAGGELAQISIIAKTGGHQGLMDIAHFCLAALSNSAVCGTVGKANARHSRETMAQLTEAHDHLCAAGASCDMRQESVAMAAKTAGLPAASELLVKMTNTLEGLTKTVTELRAENTAMAARVEEIAQQPLPPLTQKMNVPVAKAQDGRWVDGAGDRMDPEALAAFAALSKEDQTIELIKASRARPITLVRGPVPRNPERPAPSQ